MSRAVMFWLAVLLVFSGAAIVWVGSKYSSSPGVVSVIDEEAASDSGDDDVPPLTEFELVDQLGNTVNSSQFKGDVWAGSFFFASCPSTCYNQNIKLQQLHAKYADRGLKLVSITCDPVNDTPVALAAYSSRFKADAESWHFLTSEEADVDYLRRIGNDFFNIMVAQETHTDHVVVFDREGKMRGSYNVLKGEDQLELNQMIDSLLDESVEEENLGETAGETHSKLQPSSETHTT